MYVFRALLCFFLVIVSLIVAFLLYLFFPISFGWTLAIIPLDALLIFVLVQRWAKEQKEKERKAMEYWPVSF